MLSFILPVLGADHLPSLRRSRAGDPVEDWVHRHFMRIELNRNLQCTDPTPPRAIQGNIISRLNDDELRYCAWVCSIDKSKSHHENPPNTDIPKPPNHILSCGSNFKTPLKNTANDMNVPSLMIHGCRDRVACQTADLVRRLCLEQ